MKSMCITAKVKPSFSTLFVRNTAEQPQIQTILLNLQPKKARVETLEGREYTVVPMVMLTEGVHAGTSGPLYYPPEELSKTPVIWNHKPIVVYHPEMNGQGISACDVAVIETQKVGLIMNTKYSGGRLTSEAWLEKNKADKVDERIMAAVTANEMMEVSTGVFIDAEPTAGEWKTEKYIGIARNFRPDHLALLPDKIGACSIADGAGLLRNEKKTGMLKKLLSLAGVLDNEMSMSNIQSSLTAALNEKYGSKGLPGQPGYYIWVCDVYSNFAIYENDGKLFRLGYTSSDTGVTLNDEKPVEVKRVTEYRSVEGAFVGNLHQPEESNIMDKNKKIDVIVGNASSGWTEADRKTLEGFTEIQLNALHSAITKPAAITPPAIPTPVVVPTTPVVVAPVGNTATPPAPKIQTVDEYIAGAPSGIQDVLRNGQQVYADEKAKLIEVITGNKHCGFTKDELGNKPLGELKMLARLAAGDPKIVPTAPNYAGQGATPTGNEAAEEALPIPTMNFAKVEAK